MTYKKEEGFAPIFFTLDRNNLVNLELREGSQDCQKNPPEFLRASIVFAKRITD